MNIKELGCLFFLVIGSAIALIFVSYFHDFLALFSHLTTFVTGNSINLVDFTIVLLVLMLTLGSIILGILVYRKVKYR